MTSKIKPTTSEYKYLLRLLSSVINCKDAPRPNDDINWAVVFSASAKHSVAGMVYYALKSLPEQCRPCEAVSADFLSASREDIILESNIRYETDLLFDEFKKEGVDILPVKGIVLKEYYPVASMRTMSDVDILYKEQDKEKVIALFKSKGYTLKSADFNELVFTKAPVHYYELHSSLLSEGKRDYEYFSKSWDKAVKTNEPHIYTLSTEDTYIYLLEHFAKHIEGGGAGLRMVIDLYLYHKKHNKDMDCKYVFAQLEKLNLRKFAEKTEALAQSWFDSTEPDTDSVCAEFILSCPTFGVVSNAIAYNSLRYEHKKRKKQSGISRLFCRLFPPIRLINSRFSVTKKYRFLYVFFVPVYWFKRIFRDKNVNYSSVKLYLNPDNGGKTDEISRLIDEFGLDKRL